MTALLRIGDPVPPPDVQPVQIGDDSPAWFCLITRPQKEPRVAAWLLVRGVASWRPTEEIYVRRGVRQLFIRQERLILPRYLFARFTGRPLWHAVRACPWIIGAVGLNAKPAPITDAAMAQMHGVRDRLASIREAEARAARIAPGDRVMIEAGPLTGWVVEVSAVRGDALTVLAPLLGVSSVQVCLASVCKVPPATP